MIQARPTIQPTATQAAQCATVTAAEALHLRAEPNEKSAVVAYMFYNQRVTVIDDSRAWWMIQTEQATGYANSHYLKAGCK